VERSCERGNEPLGSIKWKILSDYTAGGLSISTQLRTVSQFVPHAS
jgi:hypothetical protein